MNFADECDCLQEVILRILVFKNLGLSFEHMGEQPQRNTDDFDFRSLTHVNDSHILWWTLIFHGRNRKILMLKTETCQAYPVTNWTGC